MAKTYHFLYHCGSCETGVVELLQVVTSKTVSFKVKKCTECKHQYYFKQLSDLKMLKNE